MSAGIVTDKAPAMDAEVRAELARKVYDEMEGIQARMEVMESLLSRLIHGELA